MENIRLVKTKSGEVGCMKVERDSVGGSTSRESKSPQLCIESKIINNAGLSFLRNYN
jgi:hypothetical protein